MYKVLCPEPESFSKEGLDFASNIFTLTAKTMDKDLFESNLKYFDGILIRFNTKISKKLLSKNKNIRFILSPTTGLDHIDAEYCKRKKIKIYHIKNDMAFLKQLPGTAELTFGLMLSLVRKIPSAFESVKNKNWEVGPFRGLELSDKTIGILGFGRLGKKVANIALSFNMKVIFFDPFKSYKSKKIKKINDLNKFLKAVDILSLHLHLNKNTHHLIGERELSLLKKDSIIINTSRGSIIDNLALLKFLEQSRIKGAALDVLEDEESIINKKDNPLINYSMSNNNLIITPHIGGATYESVRKSDQYILQKFLNKNK
jgi:D-3-phosphoglycerate dehydrogenase / 2-oxoglutarate reductase